MPSVFLPSAQWAASPFLGRQVDVFDEANVQGQWTGSGYGPAAPFNASQVGALTALVSGAGNTTYTVGDSLNANGYLTTGNTFYDLAPEGAFNWANAFLGSPFNLIGNTAVGGKTAQQVIDEQIPVLAALGTKPRFAVLSCGHNDIYVDQVSAQVAYSRIIGAVEGLMRLGIKPIWSTIWARAYSATYTPVHMQVNDMLRRYAYLQGTGWFWDGFEASADPTGVNNQGRLPLATHFYDSLIHPNTLLGQLIGRYQASRLKSQISAAGAAFVAGGEDQTFSGGSSNLLANPAFSGTGGSAGSNVSGTVPDNWTVDWQTRTGTGTATSAVVDITDADSSLVVGKGIQVTVAGVPASGDILRITQATGFNTLLSTGNVMQAEGCMSLASPAAVGSAALRVLTNNTESTHWGQAAQTVGTLVAFSSAFCRTREMPVLGSGAASAARYDARITFNAAGGSGTVFTLWKPRVRRVS